MSWWWAMRGHLPVIAVAGELSSAALGSRLRLGAVRAGIPRSCLGLLQSWEVDADRFVLAALLDLAALSEGAFVGLGGRLLHHEREAARPESPSRDHVSFGGEQGDVGGEIDPREQPDHEAEGAVDVAGVLERVPDVVAPQCLQQLVEDTGRDRTTAQVPPADLAGGEEAEAEPEETDVEHGRERERADLPAEPEARADGG